MDDRVCLSAPALGALSRSHSPGYPGEELEGRQSTGRDPGVQERKALGIKDGAATESAPLEAARQAHDAEDVVRVRAVCAEPAFVEAALLRVSCSAWERYHMLTVLVLTVLAIAV